MDLEHNLIFTCSQSEVSATKNSVQNEAPSCNSNSALPIISGKKSGPMIETIPHLEPEFETKSYKIPESSEVNPKDFSVNSICNAEKINAGENFIQKSLLIDRADNSMSNQDALDDTLSEDLLKNFVFQEGVTFTSTPLNSQKINKGLKNEFDKLSKINEEEESLLDVSAMGCDNKNSNNKPEHSVLRSDELTMFINNPSGQVMIEEKYVTLPKKDYPLALHVKNSESISYKDNFDKTVDDIWIEGNNLNRIKEICSSDVENKRKEIVKGVTHKPYVSPNEDENKDNNDPEWELLRKLETDDERYKAVRSLWRNLTIPNLKQNYTTFNWRKKNSLPTLKNIVPIKTNQIGKRKKHLVYECTEVFDVGIKKLEEFCRRQYQGIKLESDNDTSIMASLNKKPRLDIGSAHVANRNCKTDFDKINECFQERLQRHIEAKEEIKAVHGFYNGLKNQGNGGYGNIMYISHQERQHILDIESMINHYTVWYP